MSKARRYFTVKAKVPRQAPGVGLQAGRWAEIGRATEWEKDGQTVISGTILTVPLNWDGTFHLFLSEKQPD